MWNALDRTMDRMEKMQVNQRFEAAEFVSMYMSAGNDPL
jgi:hypothetical protein